MEIRAPLDLALHIALPDLSDLRNPVRKLLAPAAAFTMAIIVVSYTYSSINQARSESVLRQRQGVEDAKSRRASVGVTKPELNDRLS